MQAVMLAAGMGKRLGKNTEENTKCMVNVAGKKLIDWAIEAIEYAGIKKFTVVVGYKAENLISYINRKYGASGIEFTFVHNAEYERTNNIYSFYLARDYLVKDDTILMESDLIYDRSLIKKLCESKYKNIAAVARYKSWMDGTVVTCDDSGKILQFIDKGKINFETEKELYKTVNVYKLSKEFLEKVYIPFLSTYMKAYGVNNYYETVLKVIAHLSLNDLMAYEIGELPWYEIDDIQDLDIANAMFTEGAEKHKLITSKFGGYWRYSEIKDFCCLVNPYFPTKDYIDKLKREFGALLMQYPSGLAVQNMNAERIFGVDQNKILVGNGAAELINSLGKICKGKIGINVPTFNEYRRCFKQCNIEIIDNSQWDFDFNTEEIKKAADKTELICIISPDNPSGKMLDKAQIFDILDYCKNKSTKIVVDESFADFADQDHKFTLLNNRILTEYQNLIVIKSISKSYGVPGVRLGVLACGDQKLIASIRNELPIWNINSFAEYFLQTFNLYAKEYSVACGQLVRERERFISELSKFNIKVYDSQANYVLIKLNDMNSLDFCVRMLNEYNILVKDLYEKDYFGKQNYIRVAIRDTADNDLFLRAMQEVIH